MKSDVKEAPSTVEVFHDTVKLSANQAEGKKRLRRGG